MKLITNNTSKKKMQTNLDPLKSMKLITNNVVYWNISTASMLYMKGYRQSIA